VIEEMAEVEIEKPDLAALQSDTTLIDGAVIVMKNALQHKTY